MQNIASLLSSSSDGNALNSILGANNSSGEGLEGILSGQDPSFLESLSNFLDGNGDLEQAITDQSGQILASLGLQELPQDGNALPVTEQLSISDIKAFLEGLTADLEKLGSRLDDVHMADDRKIIVEHLASQLQDLQRLLQDADGRNIQIPASLASDILNNIQALRDSGDLLIGHGGPNRQGHNIAAQAVISGAQPTGDDSNESKSAPVLNEGKINQLSKIVQDLISVPKEQIPIKPDAGLSALLKSSVPSFETKNGDTLIKGGDSVTGNITGLINQASNTFGDKTMTNLPINTSFNQAGWGDEVGERVKWLVGQNIQSAKLSLNPPQLGPIEVRITVQNDQMNVTFTAHHAAVRDALESAVPRLREMFGDSGLNLADVDISQHSFSDQRRAAPDIDQTYRYVDANEQNDELSGLTPLSQRLSLHNGLVDYYA